NTPSEKINPVFSVCACRILKISSCLRIPVALETSRLRAICARLVAFISLSCAKSKSRAGLDSCGACDSCAEFCVFRIYKFFILHTTLSATLDMPRAQQAFVETMWITDFYGY